MESAIARFRSSVIVAVWIAAVAQRALSLDLDGIDYRELLERRDLMGQFAEMVLLSEATTAEEELAAFLVRTDRGGLSLVPWPRGNAERTETWRGPIPPGTIAVVHTHPNGWRRPSPADHLEAERTGLPFLVLTRWEIWLASPSRSRSVRLLTARNWTSPNWLTTLPDLTDGSRLVAEGPSAKPSAEAEQGSL